LDQAPDGVERTLGALEGVRQVIAGRTTDGFPSYQIKTNGDRVDLCPAIYETARHQSWPLRELRRDVRTLEAVFNELATAG